MRKSLSNQICFGFAQLQALVQRVYLKQNLRHLGKKTAIESSVRIEYPEKIHIEDYCYIYHGAVLIGESVTEVGIYLAKNTKVREYAHLNAYSGYIVTGSNSFIGQGCIISGNGGVEIGDNTLIGNLCSISAANHIFEDSAVPLRFQGETRQGIKIGADVWIGSQVAITDGVTIGDNAVIGAGSVVAHDIPSWAIAVGVPARIIRDRRDPK
jgi:acetyltransferase-like isoleucine patch superfamily enzyme